MPRGDAGGEDDCVCITVIQLLTIHALAQMQFYTSCVQTLTEVAQGFVKFLFAGHFASNVELATYHWVGIVQAHTMTAFGGGAGKGQSGWASTDHVEGLGLCCGQNQ